MMNVNPYNEDEACQEHGWLPTDKPCPLCDLQKKITSLWKWFSLMSITQMVILILLALIYGDVT